MKKMYNNSRKALYASKKAEELAKKKSSFRFSLALLSVFLLFSIQKSFSQIVNTESFDGTTFVPTGWTNFNVSGGNSWTRVTSGVNPSQSPNSGAGEAMFNSYNVSGGVQALITPPYSLQNNTSGAAVSFYMYRDGGYSSTADKIDVYYNTAANLTGAVSLGTVNRAIGLTPTVSANGWYQYSFTIPSTVTSSAVYLILQGTSAWGNNIFIDDVSWTSYPPLCSGAPAAANALASQTAICPGQNTSLSLSTSYTAAAGYSYQWQSSTSGASGPYTAITGATTTAYTATNVLVTTWYNCIITCSSGPASTTSTPVQVVANSPNSSNSVASFTSVCSGNASSISLSSTYTGVSYQWLSSTTGTAGPFSAISGATLSTLATGNLTVGMAYQALVSCTSSSTYSVLSAPVAVSILGAPIYASTPFLENFDNTWQNRCDLRNVPVTNYWSSTPTTGNNSWRRQDDGSSAGWSSTFGLSTPLAGAGCANFHSYDASTGTAGSLNLYLNMTAAAPNYSMSFYYRNTSGTDVLRVLLSTDAGATFSNVATYSVSSSWAKKIINLGAVNSSSCIISFSATSDYGVSDIGIDSLEVKTCPNVSPIATSSAVCPGGSSTLSVAGASVGVTNFLWSTSSTSTAISVTPGSSAVYTVTGSNGLCAVTNTIGVTVNPTPTLNITGSSGICTGQSATLNVSGASTYTWSTGSNSSQIVDAPTTNTVYTVSGTSLGCVGTNTQLVTVAASLSISIVGPSTVCAGGSATLTGNGGVNYTWNTGATTPTLLITPTGNTTYSVIGASGTCSNTALVTVTLNSNPTVSFTGSTAVCVGKSTTLTAGGSASTFSWSTGATTSTVSVAPTTNTTYVLTGFSSAGCSATAAVAVTANAVPVLSIATTATAVCVNSSATLTASGGNTYTWSLTGSPTTTAVTISPTATAVYTLTGLNVAGCSNTKTISIASLSLPNVSIAPTSATVCLQAAANFSASGATTYTWSTSGATTAATSFTPSGPGVYTVTGTNVNGCVNTATAAVTTNSLPVVSVSPPSATACANIPVSFTASGAASYLWPGSVNSVTYAAASSTSTSFTVIGYSSAGCGNTQTVGLTALPLPNVVVTPSLTTVCLLSTSIYTVSGATTYTWADNSSATTVAVTPSLATTLFNVSGTGSNGCIGYGSAIILANPLPTISISPAGATVCPNSPATFTASGGNSYSWSNGPTTATTVVTPSATSVYTVTGFDQNQCSSTQTVAVTTRSVPLLVITPSSYSACPGESGNFAVTGALTYTWVSLGNQPNITVSPSVSTVYTVMGKSTAGCVSSATVDMHIWQLPTIGITASGMTVCARELVTFTASGASTYNWFPVTASGPTFSTIAVNSTTYTVNGTDVNGCSGTGTISVHVDKCDGIATNSLDNSMRLYPNPSSGKITAEFGFEGMKTIVITNSAGAVIMEISTNNVTESIDLSQNAKGLYFIHVSAKGDSANYRVIIQ